MVRPEANQGAVVLQTAGAAIGLLRYATPPTRGHRHFSDRDNHDYHALGLPIAARRRDFSGGARRIVEHFGEPSFSKEQARFGPRPNHHFH